ncbi:hypothetical protein [Flavobacterium sp.]|jgi:hypothetical protein|uniref:hypothetical protein n=1 Tax=Flavobacterium sp. TaxID=239 RepID=UPI003BDE2220
MNTQENTIETTLQSLDNLQRLEVPIGLQFSIKNNFNGNAPSTMSTTQKWMLAASVVVLIGINVLTIKQYSKQSEKTTDTASNEKNLVYKEYFSNTIE